MSIWHILQKIELMEPISIAVGGVVLLVSAGIAVIVDQYKSLRAKNIELEELKNSLGQYSETYMFEECDLYMIDKCREFLRKEFPTGIEEKFASIETLEEKQKYASNVSKELAKIIKVDFKGIAFEEMQFYENGKTTGEKEIVLNVALVLADPEQLITTMIHELRHCLQIQSISGNDVWGFSDAKKAQWLFSFEKYQSGTICYAAYREQPVERDAVLFAESIMKN